MVMKKGVPLHPQFRGTAQTTEKAKSSEVFKKKFKNIWQIQKLAVTLQTLSGTARSTKENIERLTIETK